jgi:radical SAM superfamily enzyme YgiQ (UPF0313 family)
MLRICYQLIQAIREEYPEGIIAIGGAHVNADPGIWESIGAHYAFVGESEYMFTVFCKRVLDDGVLPDFGIFTSDPLDGLDALPMPAYDLLPLDRYYSPNSDLKTISCITSRGCPFKCSYCSRLQKSKYRYMSAENVVNMVEVLINKHGIGYIEFVDEIFTLKPERVYEFCREIHLRNLKFKWGVQTRADMTTPGLLATMQRAGLHKIGFGIETGSERVRWGVRKEITNECIEDTVRMCHDLGLITAGTFIFGHPTETVEEMKETIAFAKKLDMDFPHFLQMMPIPGAEIFDIAVKEGVIKPDVWTQYMLGHTSHPLYAPPGIPRETIDRLYSKALKSIYWNPRYLWKKRKMFLNPVHMFMSIRAFLKSLSKDRFNK